MSEKEPSYLFILADIKEDIKSLESKLDARWNSLLADFSSHKEKVHQLEQHADHTNKIILTGNGKPPITSQVAGLQRDVDEIKKNVKEATDLSRQTLDGLQKLELAVASAAVRGVPKEITIAKLKTLGVVLGLLTAALSCLAAFLA